MHGVKALCVLLALLAACGARSDGDTARANKLGALAGLARDAKTGEFIGFAEVEVAGRKTKTTRYGMYEVDGLEPGRYTLRARFADQPVTIRNIEVSPGMATYADIVFTLGDPTPLDTDWGDPREGEIKRFSTKVPRIEGTVGDQQTRARIPGAVVTAARGVDYETLQTVTDDHGRYRFDDVPPGTYAISAYYSVSGRAQIEVRRSDVTVTAGESVLVPLWIEVTGQ